MFLTDQCAKGLMEETANFEQTRQVVVHTRHWQSVEYWW